MEVIFADLSNKPLPLAEVFLDLFGLPQQEGNLFVGGLHEAVQGLERLIEFHRKFPLLLISPGLAETNEAAVQDRHLVLEFSVETLEILGESSEFFRIDNGFGHGGTP